jgi:uncharacterized protein YndB with AHSA1/START domain
MSATLTEPIKGYELKITRVFDAPRELVWKAWTDPAMAMQWAGPRGFQATSFHTPTVAGERWRMEMEGNIPGTETLARLGQGGIVKEIKPPELLVYTFAWDTRESVGLPESPYKENTVTVRFEEKGNKTLMTFTQGPFATEGECNGHTGGWNSAFDRFAEFMLAEQPNRVADPTEVPSELHLKRFFAAPRDVVFAAWTQPEILAKWWGPKGFTNPRCEFEARGGGAIRIDMRGPDGTIYPMSGKVIEFYPPYRFHFTASALDANGNSMFDNWNSVFFEKVEGGTQVTLDVHVMTQTDVAPQYLKGMKQGWSMSLDKLADLVATSN